MNKPTTEQIGKLPKWAQDYIKDVERERETAVRVLNECHDTQTPSSFYIDRLECTGEEVGPSLKRHYIQTYQMSVEHAGVSLRVMAKDKSIQLQWATLNHSSNEIGFIATSFQMAELKSKENMRG